jgi:hypothetical protein
LRRAENIMSRAVNVNASVAEVTAACAAMGTAITAIEGLLNGGTRVVLSNIGSADNVRAHYRKKLLGDRVARVPSRLRTQ